MNNLKRSIRSSLRTLSLSALALAAAATVASQLRLPGTTAFASCTISGKAVYLPDGTPACDCTASQSVGTCTCIVKCPGGGGGDVDPVLN